MCGDRESASTPRDPGDRRRAESGEHRVLLATGLFLAISLVVSLVVLVSLSALVSPLDHEKDQASRDAESLARAADLYMRRFGECPTLDDLRRERFVSAKPLTDPWNVELTIICGSDGGVAVFSPGPDRELGTADDLVF